MCCVKYINEINNEKSEKIIIPSVSELHPSAPPLYYSINEGN